MPNENRKLATLQEISSLSPIEGADLIEKATVMGWDIVVKKGEFQKGDLGVYFEIDSFLPIEDRYEFLRSSSYKKNELIGEGFRLKTAKLRGVVSQGLILPLSVFPEINFSEMKIGDDLTERLRVKLFQIPESLGSFGISMSRFHDKVSKTDELRIQSSLFMLEDLKGKPYYITEKIDGMSITIVKENNSVRIFTRTNEIKDTPESSLWIFFRESRLIEKLEKSKKDLVIQGELYGPKIQKNKLKVLNTEFRFFNLGLPKTGEYSNFTEWNTILKEFDLQDILKSVKILEVGDNFQYNLEELQEKSNGNYENAGQREGIVIRPQVEMKSSVGERLSFKVINNKFLLKWKE